MAENLRRRRFSSRLPNRSSVVAALFVGWGAIHLLAAVLNAGSSTPFFIEWFAVLGGLLVVGGGLLYRHHRFSVPIGLLCLGIASISNLYQFVVLYSQPVTFATMIVFKVALAYVLVTIARDH